MSRLGRFFSAPWTAWLERAVWVAVLAIALPRLLPHLSALSGVGSGGGAAPVFAATTLDGDPVSSASLRGSVVVVNVWATWCPPCRVEMPSLQKLWEEHRDDGLVVLGVNTDVANEAGVRAFLVERGLTFPVVRADRELRRALGGWDGLPTTFVLDREGRVRHRLVGYAAPPVLRAAVGRLLADTATAGPGEEPAAGRAVGPSPVPRPSAGTASGR